MPQDNLSPFEFSTGLFKDIWGFPKGIAWFIETETTRDWRSFSNFLKTPHENFRQSIKINFMTHKRHIEDAFQKRRITEAECKKYTDLLIKTEEELFATLFKSNTNKSSFWPLRANIKPAMDEKEIRIQEEKRLRAIHTLLKKLNENIPDFSIESQPKREERFLGEFDHEKIDPSGCFLFYRKYSRKNFHGWKLHLSVAHTDLIKAYQLVVPILLEGKLSFKVARPSQINEKTPSAMHCYGSKQITIYLEEADEDPVIPCPEIEKTLLEIQTLFKEQRISVGEMPRSDRTLKYDYFSMRNDQFQNTYIFAEDVRANYNPENRENPYASLLKEPLGHFNAEEHFNEMIDAESQPEYSESVSIEKVFRITFLAILNAYLTKEDKTALIEKEHTSLEKLSVFLPELKFKDAYETPERHRFVKDCLTLLAGNAEKIFHDENADNFLKKLAVAILGRAFYDAVLNESTTLTHEEQGAGHRIGPGM